jgi:hypothetical protein
MESASVMRSTLSSLRLGRGPGSGLDRLRQHPDRERTYLNSQADTLCQQQHDGLPGGQRKPAGCMRFHAFEKDGTNKSTQPSSESGVHSMAPCGTWPP